MASTYAVEQDSLRIYEVKLQCYNISMLRAERGSREFKHFWLPSNVVFPGLSTLPLLLKRCVVCIGHCSTSCLLTVFLLCRSESFLDSIHLNCFKYQIQLLLYPLFHFLDMKRLRATQLKGHRLIALS